MQEDLLVTMQKSSQKLQDMFFFSTKSYEDLSSKVFEEERWSGRVCCSEVY
jgi:hypothetical protein